MEVNLLLDRMNTSESSVSTIEKPLQAVENQQISHVATILAQQLQIEEIKDRGMRNNLRLRGLPEATETEALTASALAIFRDVVGESFLN